MSKFSEFRKTQIWRDLRFPLIWLPSYWFFGIVIFYPNEALALTGGSGFFTLLFSALALVIITMAVYLTLPLCFRFLILRRPLTKWSWGTIIFASIISVVISTIFGEKRYILPMIAIHYVLVAGYSKTESASDQISASSPDDAEQSQSGVSESTGQTQ